MNNENLIDENVSPLVPAELLEEYNDIIDDSLRNVLRANSVRRYLEGSIEIFMKKNITKEFGLKDSEWDKKDLFDQINLIGEYYNKKFEGKLHKVRKVGNKGSHFGKVVSNEELRNAINIINNIFEYLVIEYFKKHKFGSEPPVLTLLSALPPRSRIKIIEGLGENRECNKWIIDKLSMAYLKNNQIDKSKDYLKECLDKKYINDEEYRYFVEKIDLLNSQISKFDISKNIFDTKRIFELLITDENYKNYSEFVELFFVLLSGYNVENNKKVK